MLNISGYQLPDWKFISLLTNCELIMLDKHKHALYNGYMSSIFGFNAGNMGLTNNINLP